MKTTWKIVTCPHQMGFHVALGLSGWTPGEVRDGRICMMIDVQPFTDETFLVVAKWAEVAC